jgi:ribose 1,5-bisphosphate isomerase
MSLSKTVEDIKSLRIQGAENVAKSALAALRDVIHSSRLQSKISLLHDIAKAKRSLESARVTEPCLRNVLKYVISQSKGATAAELKESLLQMIQKALSSLYEDENSVNKIGAIKIRNGMVVFTHCHSSAVIGILKTAKGHGKSFVVHNTETRPNFQGRITAIELAKAGIKVVHYVDAAARLAIKDADIMLIGCDAFTSEGKIINKIGSELFAEICHKRDVPVYVCTTTWKFDPKTVFGFEEQIEARQKREVWTNHPKNIIVDNHAFEMIDPNLVTGMITEIGVYKPVVLVEELRSRSPWMFD